MRNRYAPHRGLGERDLRPCPHENDNYVHDYLKNRDTAFQMQYLWQTIETSFGWWYKRYVWTFLASADIFFRTSDTWRGMSKIMLKEDCIVNFIFEFKLCNKKSPLLLELFLWKRLIYELWQKVTHSPSDQRANTLKNIYSNIQKRQSTCTS